MLTLENCHKLLDTTDNKNYFKYFKYDLNVQYFRAILSLIYYTLSFSACRWQSFIEFKDLFRKYLTFDKNITEKI